MSCMIRRSAIVCSYCFNLQSSQNHMYTPSLLIYSRLSLHRFSRSLSFEPTHYGNNENTTWNTFPNDPCPIVFNSSKSLIVSFLFSGSGCWGKMSSFFSTVTDSVTGSYRLSKVLFYNLFRWSATHRKSYYVCDTDYRPNLADSRGMKTLTKICCMRV